MEGSAGTVVKQYVSRRKDAVVINTTVDREAVELLHKYCLPGRRTTGHFIARLIYEHDARYEERQRLRHAVEGVLDTATGNGKEETV